MAAIYKTRPRAGLLKTNPDCVRVDDLNQGPPNYRLAEWKFNFPSHNLFLLNIAVDLLNRECAEPTARTEKLEKRLVFQCCVTM